MLSSRLLLPKPTLNLLKAAKPKCYYYSSSSSSPIGDSKKVDDVPESNLKKYIESTHAENKTGSSWYTLKVLNTNLKDKVLGNPEPRNQTSTGKSISTLNIKVCDVEPETVTSISKPVSGSPSVEKISLVKTSDIMEGISKTVCEKSALLNFHRENSKIPEISNNSETLKVPEFVDPDKGYKIPVDGAKLEHLVCLSSHFLSKNSKKTLDEDDFNIFSSKESFYNQPGVVETEKNDLLLPNGFLDLSIDKPGGDVGKDSKVKGLVDCIKGLSVQSNVNSGEKFVISKTNQVNDKANLHVSKSKEGEISKKTHAMGKDDQISYKNSIRPGLSQTEVHNSEKKVKQSIPKSPVLSKEGEKTKGSEKKLSKIQFMIDHENNNWTQNSQDTTSSLKNTPSILDLIVDPDVPTALVKHPTRTVKIETSTNTISLRELKKALDFCGYGVTFICMGSSSSATYVEFKTEDAKERAIAAHSIQVLGDKLFIYRIDIPRTTVVRISIPNVPHIDIQKFRYICCSYGQVIRVKQRLKEIVDVEFGSAEWPNMVKILNKLNGLEKDGYRWVAQPAPIFPPNILKILWSDSDGRRHVKGVMSGILHKLGENHPATIAKLTDLTSKYHGGVNLS